MPLEPSDQQLAAIVRHIARKHLEMERGLRPPEHLAPFLTPLAYRQLRTPDRPRFPQGGPVVREDLGSVLLSHGTAGIIHATVPTRQQGDRWGALSMELRPHDDGRLRVTLIERIHQRVVEREASASDLAAPEDKLADRIQRADTELRLVEAALAAEQRRIDDDGPDEPDDKQRAQEQVDLWSRKVDELGRELADLRSRQDLTRRLAAPEETRGTAYLTTLLGPEPLEAEFLEVWIGAREAVDNYRERWGISDPSTALGPIPDNLEQRQDRERAVELLRKAADQLARSRAHEQVRECDLAGPLDLWR